MRFLNPPIIGVLLVVLFSVAVISFFIGNAPKADLTAYQDKIPRDRKFYSGIGLAINLMDNIKKPEMNTYITIPGIDGADFNVANESGQVPVFRYNESIFLLLDRGSIEVTRRRFANYRRGYVISSDVSGINQKHPAIEFELVSEGFYYWYYDDR